MMTHELYGDILRDPAYERRQVWNRFRYLKTFLVNEDPGLVHFHMLYPKCANSLEVDSFQPLEGNNGDREKAS